MKRRGIRNAVVVFALALLCGCRRQETDSQKLLTLAARSERPIDARLTGFDWQQARVQRGPHTNPLDPERLELAGAASTVIQSLANDSSARARHEAGAAYLLIDRDRDAIDALESAVRQSPKDAAYWSDLSAARYTLAAREKRPHELPQALADADHALRLHPALPDALYNRALIIESLGVTEAARRAWQRYAAADPSTHWSAEALHHLGNLRVVTTRDEFQQHLAAASRAFRGGNDALLVALARNYPQESRTWSEGPLLAKWADAIHKNDAKTAAETLSIVRKLGAALAEFNGVHTVDGIVATIDRADAEHVRLLADAHATYRDGRVLYSQRRVADAQKQLRHAEELFKRTGSPMALITDYYLANGLYDTNHVSDAERALDNLAGRVDPKRYPGLLAEIKWEQTLCHGSMGEWDAAIRTATESRNLFVDLGETENRAQIDLLLASHLNRASQPAAAWKARTAAFFILSRTGSTDVIRSSLISAIYAEAARNRPESALALTTIALDELRNARQPIAVTLAEAARAEALANLGEFAEAHSSIARARLTASTIPDPDLQKRTSAAIDIAEAVWARRSTPDVSLHLLDQAVEFYISHNANAWLPKAYLERGRTQILEHNDTGALENFEAGISELDAQRSSERQKDARATFYDTAPELFSESIALLLRHGDIARAFEFADRARARSVYEQLGADIESPTYVRGKQLLEALPKTGALIEYTLLPDSIVIFYFTSAGSGATQVATSSAAVETLVERANHLLQQRGDVPSLQNTAAALYRLLIAPIAHQLAGVDRLIVVPDRQLHTLPFASLFDAAHKRYLVEDFALSIAPSGASMLRRSNGTLGPVLVVGDPHDEDAPALPAATREAQDVASIYESATLLLGEKATRARFITAARQSGMIHYAGHAEGQASESSGVLHLATGASRVSGDLDATAIAALRLRNAPLVILAACGTMHGDSEHVEGMPSIARAFLAAGARSVVGTLWDVDDDAVAPLFQRMHLELHKGASPSAALRTAQIGLAHDSDPRLSHPATWSSVELLGYANE